MKRFRLEVSGWMSMGVATVILGIFIIIIGIIEQDLVAAIKGSACIGLGVAYTISGIEKISGFKLDVIYKMLGPYENKKINRFVVSSIIFKLIGVCSFLGGTTINSLIAFNRLPTDLSDIGLTLLVLSFAFFTLGRLHDDNRKYDDIFTGLKEIQSEIKEISQQTKIIKDQAKKKKGRVKKNIVK
jgi:hypothetical protein